MVERTVTEAPVFRVNAPPAWHFLHALHFQMPTAERLTAYLPQKEQKYLECWLTSIFLICLRSDAPYRVPYLPTMPTFFVRFDILARLSPEQSRTRCAFQHPPSLAPGPNTPPGMIGPLKGATAVGWIACIRMAAASNMVDEGAHYSVSGGLLSFDFSLGCFLLSFLQAPRRLELSWMCALESSLRR